MEITVHLGPRSYPIVLDHGAFNDFPARVKKLFPDSRFALVTNVTLARLYRPVISSWKKKLSCEALAIPDGEKYKTVATWQSVLDFLLKSRLDRKSVVIALGGGVVGDVAGFAAASFLRGVAYVQVPTTLLAMVDSSVGGKTAVDHALGKNLIGAFHQPSLVWLDTAFLTTLPCREFLAGYAELFKYAFIGGREMFAFVLNNHEKMIAGDTQALFSGIKRSLEIKAAVVESDEKEVSGRRALLNFGHTFAHAIERFYHFRTVLHGEAVFAGMRCACDLGMRFGSIPAPSRGPYSSLLSKLPTIRLPSTPDAGGLYRAMFTDKKMSGGKLVFVLPRKPGVSALYRGVPEKLVLETLRGVLG
ncbi:MAG TPA: 3-dehydroquinate synthase [Chitinivibrionales bacterium]|nr:3-dehydroquinate synthase [Chitinivibrionales bacterium]